MPVSRFRCSIVLVAAVLLVRALLAAFAPIRVPAGIPLQEPRSPVLRSPRIARHGAIGDSLTDEYLEQNYDYARAWTELFVEARWIEMGPTAAEAGVGNWGEPRRTG